MDVEKGLAYALNYLSLAPKSTFQLRQKLKEKGAEKGVIDQIIEKINGYGYLDNLEYGRLLIESYKKKGKSRLYTRNKLREKGLNPRDFDSLFDDLYSFEDETAIARQKWEQNQQKPPKKRVEFLLRQGFSYQMIADLIEK